MNNLGTDPESKPDSGPGTFNLKLIHGLNQHQLAVPANSTFGDLKSIIAQNIGLKPEMHKLLFRGKEREDDDDLQTTGVKDNSKVLIVEDATCRQKSLEEVEEDSKEQILEDKECRQKSLEEVEEDSKEQILEDTQCSQKSPEDIKETNVISQGCQEVALVREEVDMLSEQVSALQAVVDDGTKVADKDIVYLTEMLMRQLLKLDDIVAVGEGRVQRKMEVRRIQGLMDTVDILKSKNSNSPSEVDNIESVAASLSETSKPGDGSVSTSPMNPSSTSAPESTSISTLEPCAAPIPVELPADSTQSSIPTPALTQLSAPPPTTNRKGNL